MAKPLFAFIMKRRAEDEEEHVDGTAVEHSDEEPQADEEGERLDYSDDEEFSEEEEERPKVISIVISLYFPLCE